jgi:hypothetical protein
MTYQRLNLSLHNLANTHTRSYSVVSQTSQHVLMQCHSGPPCALGPESSGPPCLAVAAEQSFAWEGMCVDTTTRGISHVQSRYPYAVAAPRCADGRLVSSCVYRSIHANGRSTINHWSGLTGQINQDSAAGQACSDFGLISHRNRSLMAQALHSGVMAGPVRDQRPVRLYIVRSLSQPEKLKGCIYACFVHSQAASLHQVDRRPVTSTCALLP